LLIAPLQVTEFFKKAKAHEIARDAHCGEDDFVCQMQAYWTAPFMPNLLNTVVFLVETSQMISVFFANYKGRPWMKGMLENHPLFLSVFACIGGVVVAAWEFVPQLNEIIQLAPFPDDAFRSVHLFLVAFSALCLWLGCRLALFESATVVLASVGRCSVVVLLCSSRYFSHISS
jgi:magnesium-transporting ATPase (P-type)